MMADYRPHLVTNDSRSSPLYVSFIPFNRLSRRKGLHGIKSEGSKRLVSLETPLN